MKGHKRHVTPDGAAYVSVSILDMRDNWFVPQSQLERSMVVDLSSVYHSDRRITQPAPLLAGESVGDWRKRLGAR